MIPWAYFCSSFFSYLHFFSFPISSFPFFFPSLLSASIAILASFLFRFVLVDFVRALHGSPVLFSSSPFFFHLLRNFFCIFLLGLGFQDTAITSFHAVIFYCFVCIVCSTKSTFCRYFSRVCRICVHLYADRVSLHAGFFLRQYMLL